MCGTVAKLRQLAVDQQVACAEYTFQNREFTISTILTVFRGVKTLPHCDPTLNLAMG